MLKIIDTHAHLNDKVYNRVVFEKDFFANEKYELEKVITVAYDKKSIAKTIDIINQNARVYGAIGVHPHEVKNYDQEVEDLIIYHASNKKVVAIGEIGLDYFREENKKQIELQKTIFVKQLHLAYNLGLPVIIHIRDAFLDAIQILKTHKKLLKHGGVVHCFTGEMHDYLEIQALGLKISVGGVITFNNADQIKNVVKHCNTSDLVIETDCPYLTPHPHRGREKNQPLYVSYVLEKVAEIKNLPLEKVAAAMISNTYQLFKRLNN